MKKGAAKKLAKMLTDIVMTAILAFLANRQNGTGLLLHAVLGIVLFVLFALHHFLNASYFKSLFKGTYNVRRIVLAAANASLFAAMLLMAASSLMISGLVFNVAFLPVNFAWRNIHASCSSWMFMIAAFHISLHAHSALSRFERKMPRVIFVAASVFVFGAGVFAFSQSKIFSNLFLFYTDASLRYSFKTQIVFSMLMIFAVCLASHFVLKICERRKANSKN
ncbi:MAG: DUF4405 domain-containing protein [Bacteroides sp.]|nr:DUF4405 domain-containing protein [Prevotella sp.]MCM1407159.1 DUF4405 domain-containing protein [Treponema brennaborense]MCM1470311.1 DUF4405 domain-containing protein [Bacteroides sp.]